jgi:large subunit ribosomal protein L17
MRHLKAGRKLGRNSAHRRALFRNLVTSLIENGRVRTTDAKAKELRRYADRMITLGKQQSIAARRRARRFVQTDAAVARLFNDLAPLFARRAGGYTRIIKVAARRGDAAPLSFVELTEQLAVVEPDKKSDDKSKDKKSKDKKS